MLKILEERSEFPHIKYNDIVNSFLKSYLMLELFKALSYMLLGTKNHTQIY